MKEEEEEFRDIPGYDGLYQVSNLGNVKSLSKVLWNGITFYMSKEKTLKNTLRYDGYYVVSLYLNKKQKTHTIHQLVAIAFLNHTPNGYNLIVDHINRITTDNRVENLQLITQRENASKDRTGGTSKYLGVLWDKILNKWTSSIYFNGKNINLGRFNSEEEASDYYQNALKAIENNEEIIKNKVKFSSKYTGVSWCKIKKRWVSTIRIDAKRKHLGYFKCELEAHNAYQNKLKEIQNEG